MAAAAAPASPSGLRETPTPKGVAAQARGWAVQCEVVHGQAAPRDRRTTDGNKDETCFFDFPTKRLLDLLSNSPDTGGVFREEGGEKAGTKRNVSDAARLAWSECGSPPSQGQAVSTPRLHAPGLRLTRCMSQRVGLAGYGDCGDYGTNRCVTTVAAASLMCGALRATAGCGRFPRLLHFLRVPCIVALHLASKSCYGLCRAVASGKLLVPVFLLRKGWLPHVELPCVEVLFADEIGLVKDTDSIAFADVVDACGAELRCLYCAGNPGLAVRLFPALLASKPRLRTLDLARDDLARHARLGGLTPLFKALPAGLRVLDLSFNGLQDSSVCEFVDALGGGAARLERIALRTNRLGDRGGLALAALLRCAAGEELRHLDLRANRLGLEGACAMLASLESHACMCGLRLGFNAKLGPWVVGSVGTVLQRHSKSPLLLLDLSNAHIGDEGAADVALSLAENGTLACLELEFNVITGTGVRALANSLARNYALKIFNLRDNAAADDGAEALAEALIVNTTLRQLLLARNSIQRQGACALAAMLAKNVRVLLDVTNNDIPYEIMLGSFSERRANPMG